MAARRAVLFLGRRIAVGRAAAVATSPVADPAAHARASSLRGAGHPRRVAHSLRGRVRHADRAGAGGCVHAPPAVASRAMAGPDLRGAARCLHRGAARGLCRGRRPRVRHRSRT